MEPTKTVRYCEKLYSCYNLLQEPEYMNLSPEKYMRYFVDIEKKACSMIDSLSSVEFEEKSYFVS